jgi:hypothetical protein
MKCAEDRGLAWQTSSSLAIMCLAAWIASAFLPSAAGQKPADAKQTSGAVRLPLLDISIADNRQYLVRLKYVLDQEGKYFASKQGKGDYHQDRGRLECYLGWYQEALADSDRAIDWQPADRNPEALQGFEPQDAIEAP